MTTKLFGEPVRRREDARLIVGQGRYLDENPAPTREQVREAISGNLCRCTGYQNIVASVLRAAEITRDRAAGEDGAP